MEYRHLRLESPGPTWIGSKGIFSQLECIVVFPPDATKTTTLCTLKKYQVINEKLDKLLVIRFVCEVRYLTWLANMVIVPKKIGKWRTCVDYTNLNRACPKDSFPLPQIDQLVDSLSGHEVLSFLDAYNGHNQILMHPDDV